MTDLWCVHVLGPDSIIAMPDRETADLRAKEWNQMIAEVESAREPSPYWPTVRCEVIPYPYDPEGHAEQLAEHGGNPEDIC